MIPYWAPDAVLLFVTGRELDDLKRVFPGIGRCQLVVAENGALLYEPKTQQERSLVEPPNPHFLPELTARGVPFSVGRNVVATWPPTREPCWEVIRQLGVELQVSFNRGERCWCFPQALTSKRDCRLIVPFVSAVQKTSRQTICRHSIDC